MRDATTTSSGKRDGALTLLRQGLVEAGADPGTAARVATEALQRHALEPVTMAQALRDGVEQLDECIVSGVRERRAVVLRPVSGDDIVVSLSGLAVGELPWPVTGDADLRLDSSGEAVSRAGVSPGLWHRLTRPTVLVVALYHPENFPLPRFPLGISDLARAIRATMIGQVSLMDMQLGATVQDILERVAEGPDILGVSATFGQHDVMLELLDQVPGRDGGGPAIVLGGSLSALNRDVLLDRYPGAVVARGPGEPTMQDLVRLWHGELAIGDVRSLAYKGQQPLHSITTDVKNREYTDILPELDLLEATLDNNGVMQLESSRGCTHACSFCPRDHKGRWSGYDPELLDSILEDIDGVYQRHPHISRRIFLVDEEFVGSDKYGTAVERAREVCTRIHDAGFEWETSTRVDQVYRPDRDKDWHVERIEFWSYVREHGLNRCLFGVESGVDSILERFNKHATAEQNAYAVRILTALGVPIRCTYITFDQLMDFDELVASYRYQGRMDMVLKPAPHMTPEELYEAIHDDDFVASQAAGQPFYAHISYMLVTMECLLNSPYLRRVEERGLAGEIRASMGKREARFEDPRIGAMSDWAQRWVDRNFSFDYTLKSLEKIAEGQEWAAVRRLRVVLKQSAYQLFGRMLAVVSGDDSLLDERDPTGKDVIAGLPRLAPEAVFRPLLDATFDELRVIAVTELDSVARSLSTRKRAILEREHARWSERGEWELINDF